MRKRNVALVIAAVGLVLLLWFVWDQQATLAALRGRGPLPFFAAMAVLPAVGAPFTPFFLLAGASFGLKAGLVGSMLALALNLALCYAIARSGLHRRLESLLARFDYEMPSFAQRTADAVRFTILVKLTPGLPTFAKHYGLALAGVPFAIYFGISLGVTGIYAGLVVALGESVLEHDLGRTLVAGVIAAALAAGLWWWHGRRERAAALPAPAGEIA